MAPRTRQDGPRVLIIEDSMAAVGSLRHALARARRPDGTTVASAMALDHAAALGDGEPPDADVYLVDAQRHPNERLADPSLSALGGLEVAQRINDRDPGARVIGYSARAADPEINIAFREIGVVRAVYDEATLVAELAEALWSDTYAHQVRPPEASDYRALGLLPEARPWAALCIAHSRPDTWEAICRTQPHRGLQDRTRAYFNAAVGPLLPTESPVNYRHHVAVLRRVAGFYD